MKNLLIYISSDKKFDEETDLLVKIQIDNSLDLGWKREDIMLVTNFPYEYNGISAIVVPDELYCTFYRYISKINVIVYLFEQGKIDKDEIYWFHDFDAYENNKIDENEIREEIKSVDAGFAKYGTTAGRLNCGSFFFKDSAGDIFRWMKEIVYSNSKKWEGIPVNPGDFKTEYRRYSEEIALEELTFRNAYDSKSRIKQIDYTYNFGMRNVRSNYYFALKPIRVLHFHPHNPLINTLDIAMYGNNRIHQPLMTDRLIKIFNDHGIK
jgi:hypothetical protein